MHCRSVLASKAFDTLQFDDNDILDEEIGHINTNRVTLVNDRKSCLRCGANSPSAELKQKSAFIDLLKKARPKIIRDLENSADDPLSQGAKFQAHHSNVAQEPNKSQKIFFSRG